MKSSLLPNKPGVYRFLDANKNIIYVGKARDLKKRVSQYFQKKDHDRKTQALIEKIVDVEITVTQDENQALLLECALIKQYQPKYNILMRDDKSYPYIFLSAHDFPRLDYARGTKKEKGQYFGPYPNAGSVRDNIALIQKLFKLRNCRDVFYNNRSRPCLQYQLNRCTAPCVSYVSQSNYAEQVRDAVLFLKGKNNEVIRDLKMRMKKAAEMQEYEKAAHCRDLMAQLTQLKMNPETCEWVKQVEYALNRKYAELSRVQTAMAKLQEILGLASSIERIECFDISHTQGAATKASCVVFGKTGAMKTLYRQYNIDNITPGDDYAAMRQVLTRRYSKLKTLPDIVMIDGGVGQLRIAEEVMDALDINNVVLMGVAKGVTRKAGLEKIILSRTYEHVALSQEDSARLLIQQIRDEAHRFAITAHRKKLRKNLMNK